MQGNFSYHNPTKLYFGEESLNYLKDELKNFGPIVLLNYGGGSVTRMTIRNTMAPALGYSTVYPLSMFLRIFTAQIVVLFFCG